MSRRSVSNCGVASFCFVLAIDLQVGAAMLRRHAANRYEIRDRAEECIPAQQPVDVLLPPLEFLGGNDVLL